MKIMLIMIYFDLRGIFWIIMYDRNKNKVKIEINKALQNLSYILPPTSEARSMLEQSGKDFQF